MEIPTGREELIKLLERMRLEREGRPQKKVEKGPSSWKLERSTEMTRRVDVSHLMPVQLQGVSSWSFHEARD